jgi:hypothetical protein
MMSINDFKSLPGRDPDDWRRKLPVGVNEGCSCPKPFLSVLQVCRWCLLTQGAVLNDPPNAKSRLWMVGRFIHRQRQKSPLYGFPKRQRSANEKSVPFGADYAIVNGRKRPSTSVDEGNNPEIKDLGWHRRKEGSCPFNFRRISRQQS